MLNTLPKEISPWGPYPTHRKELYNPNYECTWIEAEHRYHMDLYEVFYKLVDPYGDVKGAVCLKHQGRSPIGNAYDQLIERMLEECERLGVKVVHFTGKLDEYIQERYTP